MEEKFILLQIENTKILQELSSEAAQVQMNGNNLSINKFLFETEAEDLLGSGIIFNEKGQPVTQIKRILKCNPL
jgi:hypothetical protein